VGGSADTAVIAFGLKIFTRLIQEQPKTKQCDIYKAQLQIKTLSIHLQEKRNFSGL